MKRGYMFFTILVLAINQTWAQPTAFDSRGVGGGGALFFPTINPVNDNEFYIACDMSEMFHSTDYGSTYSQLHFSKLTSMNVSTYEFTTKPNVAYSIYNDGNEGYPVKTNDGGNTWIQLPGFDASAGMVNRICVNYDDPRQLLMNYYGKIVFSNDSGATFQTVKVAANNGVGIILAGAWFEGSNIYVASNEGMFSSSNGGTSFAPMVTTGMTPGQVIWHFSAGKNGGLLKFVCIASTGSSTYNGIMPWDYWGHAKGVYTMDNANGTWVSKSSGINFSNDYVMYTGMARFNPMTIYLGGNDASTGGALVYKSVDAGATWNKVFNTASNQNIKTGWSGQNGDKGWSWGETTFGIAVAANNANKVLFGDFGFVHTTADGGVTWKQAYVNTADQHPANAATPAKQTYHSIGLENTTCWQVDWQDGNNVMAAFSDIGGIRSTDSGKAWGFTYSGMSVNSIYRIAKTLGGTMFAGTSNVHDMYQSTRLKDAQLDAADGNGKVMYSMDKGATWGQLHSFGHPVFWLAIDPNDSNTMYASVIHYGGGGGGMQGGIWVTHNLNSLGSSTWTKLPAPPRTEGHPASIIVLNDGKVVCSFSGRINGSSQFTASSGVFIYDPSGGGSWADVSDANMQYWTKDIIIDPTDATQNTWYACVFSGWGSSAGGGKGGLYKTTNRGTAWTKLTATQFDRVTSITFNPLDAKEAYLTTEMQGLWFSNNMNTATPTWSLVNSYPFRQPERVYFNPYKQTEMWVTSFGNGLKVSSTGVQPGSVANAVRNEAPIVVYPNPAKEVLHVSISQLRKDQRLNVYNAAGQVVRSVVANAKETEINTGDLPAGTYWIRYGNNTIAIVVER